MTDKPLTSTVDSDNGGAFLEINEKKLGRKGLLILGGINALRRQAAMFGAMREKSEIVLERTFLSEIVKALLEEAEKGEQALAEHAIGRGAGKLHEVPDDATKQ